MSHDIPASAAHLAGQWFHSHEDDRPGTEVYRPSTFAFPRARMPRESITLHRDGSAEVGRPGPADRTDRTPATWTLVDHDVVVDTRDGRTLHLTVGEQGSVGGRDQTVLLMTSAEPGGADDDQHTRR